MQNQGPIQVGPVRVDGPAGGNAVIELPGGGRIVVPGGVTNQGLFNAARAKREVVSDLLQRARTRRQNAANELRESQPGADRAGIEKRIEGLDQRIYDLEKQQVDIEGEMVALRSLPGVSERPERPVSVNMRRSGPPEEFFIVVPILLILFGVFPIAVAYSRRIWKRGAAAAAALPHGLMERFSRLEQNVDTMAVEIERISEGQRFMTKLFAESNERVLARAAGDPAELGFTSAAPAVRRAP